MGNINTSKKISYRQSGVNYDLLDPAKRMAQAAGLKTAGNLKNTPYREFTKSRGESAYIIEAPDCFYAIVEEGLGTKNLVADAMRKVTGKTYYREIALDTVACIVNDLITTGAKPLTVLAYWGVGNSQWFSDRERVKDLVEGWKDACDMSGATWGGGETPSDTDLINPDSVVLAGAAYGIVSPKERIITGEKIKAGDAIILFESNGIHANGITLTRRIAEKIPRGYRTKLPDGMMFGEEILKPSVIYAKVAEAILSEGAGIHYLIHITGHGWRKIMRANRKFRYVLDDIPEIPELFSFIREQSGLSIREMYGTFNMGAGFAVIVDKNDVQNVLSIAKKHKIKAWLAGEVKEGDTQVEIPEYDIIFRKEELSIR